MLTSASYSSIWMLQYRGYNVYLNRIVSQKGLSYELDDFKYQQLTDKSSPDDKACLLSVSAKPAVDPVKFHTAVKCWLELDISYGSMPCMMPGAHAAWPP